MGSVGVRGLASPHPILGAMAGPVCPRLSSNMEVVRAMLFLLSFCCRRRLGRYGSEGQFCCYALCLVCLWRCTSRCVPLGCWQVHDFCILAGVDQKDSLYAWCWF